MPYSYWIPLIYTCRRKRKIRKKTRKTWRKRRKEEKKKAVKEEAEKWKWWEEERKDDGTKWKFLEHKGPVFAPPYEPLPDHVGFYYGGKRVSCLCLNRINKTMQRFLISKSQMGSYYVQGGHGTGKTGNLVLTFSRQGKHREFCCNTGNFFETQGKYFWLYLSLQKACFPSHIFNFF